jgi:hypothetical protein
MFKSKKVSHAAPLDEPPPPSFKSVFAMLHIDDGTMRDTAGVSKKTWIMAATCANGEANAALQHGVSEINNWLFRMSSKPALEQVLVVAFGMMADQGFESVPGAAELTRRPLFHEMQSLPAFQLAPVQRLLFKRNT